MSIRVKSFHTYCDAFGESYYATFVYTNGNEFCVSFGMRKNTLTFTCVTHNRNKILRDIASMQEFEEYLAHSNYQTIESYARTD